MSQTDLTRTDPYSVPLLSDAQDTNENRPLNRNDSLYPPQPPPKRSIVNRYSWIVALLLLALFIGLLAIPRPTRSPSEGDDYDDDAPVPDVKGVCEQRPLDRPPDDDISKALLRLIDSDDYRRGSAERLSGAIQVPTESFDDMGPVGEDPRWDVFAKFHEYLEKTYPKV
jgi:Gly-Xaa carboxypeptidase